MLTLTQALALIVAEARSWDGVTEHSYRIAQATTERAQQQLTMLQRILHECNNDGVTDEALAVAEAVLGQSVNVATMGTVVTEPTLTRSSRA